MDRNAEINKIRIKMEQLAKRLEKLEQEPARCKPQIGDKYYYADPTDFIFSSWQRWDCDKTDNQLYCAGLICETQEEAAELGKKMYYRQWYASLSDVTDKMKLDPDLEKYYAWYNFTSLVGNFGSTFTCIGERTYFTTEEKCQEAIETIGKGNFIKYVLGVNVNE